MGVLSNLRSNLKISQEYLGLENDYATRIQKHVRGLLTRNAFKRDIMHIKNQVKRNKSSLLELKHKNKSLTGSTHLRNSLPMDEHALRNVISDDIFEDAILLANLGKSMTGGRGQEDLEVKVKSSKAFSVISEGKDGREEGKK